MTEILVSNFEENIKLLEKSLKTAIFIAIDGEFSGLPSADTSLFDTNEERYTKLKSSIKNNAIIQFGIAAFHYHELDNSYSADVFNIYLFPRYEESVTFKSSSVEFLKRHKFNFDKAMCGGIPYVTIQKASQLKVDLAAGTLIQKLYDLCDFDTQDDLQEIGSRVGRWLATAKEGDQLIINCSHCPDYFLIHHFLRISFPTIWTDKLTDTKNHVMNKSSEIVVTKINPATQAEKLQMRDYKFEEEVLKNELGFYRIFSVLAELSVPIIGHNILLDLMMTFRQFIEPLPETYNDFKSKLHEILPQIYDTKFICLEVKNKIDRDDLWNSSLQGAYLFMNSEYCISLFPGHPKITTKDYAVLLPEVKPKMTVNSGDCTTPEEKEKEIAGYIPTLSEITIDLSTSTDMPFHEAGWDAFCTGFLYLRLAHIEAYWNHQEELKENNKSKKESNVEQLVPNFTWKELLKAGEVYENKIHVTMGKVSHMSLGSSDNKSHRPPLLHVQSRSSNPLDVAAIQDMFIRFGSVDIKLYSQHKALVACPNISCVRDILLTFQCDPTIKVELYSIFHHSVAVRSLLWMSAVACFVGGGTLLWSCIHHK